MLTVAALVLLGAFHPADGAARRAARTCHPATRVGSPAAVAAYMRAVARKRTSIRRYRASIVRHGRALRRAAHRSALRHRRAIRHARAAIRRLQRQLACQTRYVPDGRRTGGQPGSDTGRRPRPVIRPPTLSNPREITAAPCAPEGPYGVVPSDYVSRNELDKLGGGDFVIRIAGPLRCPLWISGGHSVVIVGGEVDVSGPTSDCRPPSFSPCDAMGHAGIYLRDQSGTVYVEGVWLHGSDIGVGVDQSEPNRSSELDLVNVRVDDLHTYDTATVWAANGNAPSGVHPDCLASLEGPGRIRIDGFTCGTDYFGFQLSPFEGDCGSDQPITPCQPPDGLGPQGGLSNGVELHRTNIYDNCWTGDGANNMCGYATFMFWYSTNGVPGSSLWQTSVDDVWVDPGRLHNGRGPWTWGICRANDSQNCAAVNRSINFAARPRTGDFVPAGYAGMSYRAP
jgi:hypothetical protein